MSYSSIFSQTFKITNFNTFPEALEDTELKTGYLFSKFDQKGDL